MTTQHDTEGRDPEVALRAAGDLLSDLAYHLFTTREAVRVIIGEGPTNEAAAALQMVEGQLCVIGARTDAIARRLGGAMTSDSWFLSPHQREQLAKLSPKGEAVKPLL